MDSNQVVLSQIEELVEQNKANGWQSLTAEERGCSLAFVLTGYNIKATAKELGVSSVAVRRMLRNPLVASYVAELQNDDFTCKMVNKQFIVQHLLDMIPKLSGDETVPVVLADGTNVNVNKFYPGELRAVLETLAKTTEFEQNKNDGKSGGVNIEINLGSLVNDAVAGQIKIINHDSEV